MYYFNYYNYAYGAKAKKYKNNLQSIQTIKLLTILATNNVLNGSVVAFATECGSPKTEQEQIFFHNK